MKHLIFAFLFAGSIAFITSCKEPAAPAETTPAETVTDTTVTDTTTLSQGPTE